VAKGVTREAFVETFAQINWLPRRFVRACAAAVPCIELAVGFALVTVPKLGGFLAVVLLAAFAAVAESVRFYDNAPRCSCFGGFSDDRLGRGTSIRNVFLAAVATVVVVEEPTLTTSSVPAAMTGVVLAASAILINATASSALLSRSALIEIGAAQVRHEEGLGEAR